MRNKLFNLTLLTIPVPAHQHRLQDRRTSSKEAQVCTGQCPTGAAWHVVWVSLGTQTGRGQSPSWVCKRQMPPLIPSAPAHLQPSLPAHPREHCEQGENQR